MSYGSGANDLALGVNGIANEDLFLKRGGNGQSDRKGLF
jgi:hypothetical protein